MFLHRQFKIQILGRDLSKIQIFWVKLGAAPGFLESLSVSTQTI